MDVWGHSWELDGEGGKWDEMEKFLQLISNNPSICYSRQIDLVDYITAFKHLKFSVDHKIITNLSSIKLFMKTNNKVFSIDAGETIILNR